MNRPARRETRLPPEQTASERLPVLARRVAARIIDSIVMATLAFAVWAGVWLLIALRNPRTTDPLADADRVNAWFNTNMGWLTAATVIGVLLGYEAVLTRLTGGTAGKHLARIQVRRHTDGNLLTWPQAIGRTLLAVAVPVISQACWASLLWRRDRRGIHDLLHNSAVTRRSSS